MLAAGWGLSAARLRFLPEYGKDDYRGAVEAGLREAGARGLPLVWEAENFTARYYGLQMENRHLDAPWPVRGSAVLADNWPEDEVRELRLKAPSGIVLVSSKADLFDQTGAWSRVIQKDGSPPVAVRNAFEVYVLRGGAAGPEAGIP
jgi:hypothetical protein